MGMLQQMAVFFIMVAVGWIARRARIFTPESQPQFSAFVASVAGPCLMVSSALDAGERMDPAAIVDVYVVFAALLACMLALGATLPYLLRFPKRDRGVVNLLYWLTNIGFLGMPLMGSVYGPESMIYITLYVLPNNVLLYTYGIWCVAGPGHMSPRMLANPGVAASVVAMAIYFGGIELPGIVAQSVGLIGGLTAPLAMMLVGASLFDVDVKHMLTDARLWLFCAFSMVVLPIAVTLVFSQFVTDRLLLAACMVILACPSGVMASIFASMYNEDAYLFSSECIALTTLASVATMPIVSLATGV